MSGAAHRLVKAALALALALSLPASDAGLARKLQAALKAKGPGYKPRTRHLSPRREPLYTNRLILETSPYLLQHAHNPVDWRPWGDEAFEAARKLGRPVLLSVGYSTCHWCHVMEEESFEDPEIARYLNANYIAIKVDREERPDVDSIYMTAVQTLTGAAGGWPMTVWLAPDRRPFHAATYIPPRDGDRGVQTGFLTMLRKLKEAYDTDHRRVTDTATAISNAVREALAPQPGGDVPPAGTLRKAATVAADWFDPVEGGVKGAPKFPSGLPQRFLLRHHRRSGDARALAMARLTLEKIARGGIHDHAGGGFHRYATDARWLIPHFEKMLYDNALLALDYLEAFQATGAEEFAQAARGILRWVERDMTSPEGAFYSATDADSLDPSGKREEGWFFTWTPEEIEAVAGADRAKLLRAWFGVKAGGNFERRSILYTPRPIADAAAEAGWSPEKARAAIEESKELLYAARRRRPPPLRDEKILTSWNGLMISAHARASLVLADGRYSARAARAAAFVLRNLKRNGRLLRSYKDGAARHNGYL
ncbi:MAG: thioredoxin domain-containing protein, partial [Bryobacteraceae bacterium]